MKSTFLLFNTLWSLLTWSTGTPEGTPEDVPFPTCSVTIRECSVACRTGKCCQLCDNKYVHDSLHHSAVWISSSYTGEYSADNVLCINYDNWSVPPYRLQGCPNVRFFNTVQNTSGVCSIKKALEENATDLLLLPNELEPGLYSFNCLYSISPTHTVLSNAIVGKLKCDVMEYRKQQILRGTKLLR